jgi:hypothetical protein
VADLFEQAAEVLQSAPFRDNCLVRLPARGRLLATGDLHDSPIHLDKVLKVARLDASADNHVILHELIHGERLVNGMDFSHRILARVAGLVVDRPAQVHPLLANHEMSQMTGAAVSKGAGNSNELFDAAVEFVFGERADEVIDAIHTFIGAMPLALRSESGLHCSHSLPSAQVDFDSSIFDRSLVPEDFVRPAGGAYQLCWGRRYDQAAVDRCAEAWGTRLFIVGHERVDTGIELRAGRVIVLNTDHERATVLPLDLAALPDPEEALLYAIPLASVGL